MKRRFRRAGRKAGAAVVVGVVFLALLEVTIRLLGVAPPMPKIYADTVYVPDPYLPYHQKPLISRDEPSRTGEFREVFSHNSKGFRDVEHALEKPPGTYRILGVGGSLTYGSTAPFAETYLALLEEDLNARRGGRPRVEIIKAGIGGFFPEAERLLVRHYGLAYGPDLVLVEFDETDLFETFLGAESFRVFEGFLKTAEMRELGYVRTFFSVYSHVGRILYRRWSRTRLDGLSEEFEARREEIWVRVEEEFSKMKALVEDTGARLVVSYIPLSLPSPGDELERLEALCRRRGIPLIDTTAFLEKAAREGPVYWEKDRHCNPRGYRAIAEALADGLETRGLVE